MIVLLPLYTGLPLAKANRSAQPSPQTRDKSRDTLRDAPRYTYLPAQTSRKPNDVSRDRLWEDPDFRTVASSIYYKNPPSGWPDIVWKRPHVWPLTYCVVLINKLLFSLIHRVFFFCFFFHQVPCLLFFV